MKKYKATVIGIGNMGKNHARVYSEISEIELVAVSDSNPVKDEMAKKFGARFYANFEKMIEIEEPDIVSICVPTSQHYEIAKKCILRGINVLLEKPISDNLEHAQELLVLAREKKIKFLVGHVERFNPIVKKVKEIIRNGELGKIIAVIARRVGIFPPQISDVNVAIDLAIHDIDIANYLLEELPIEIRKNGQKNLTKNREDSVEFFMKYKSGTSAYIQANWITPVKIRKLNITGEKGYLEADYISQEIEFYESRYTKEKDSKNLLDDILHFSEPDKMKIIPAKKEPLKEEILYFIGCVENNKEIDSQFAIDSLKIALNL